MQSAEEENQSKSRSDEESINFRPSPNFKHMKKYLKSKFEEANLSMAKLSTSNGSDTSFGLDKREKVNTVSNTPVQPPLPPNPPPPDTPPMLINLKKEIEDDEYCNTNVTPNDFNHTEELKTVTIKTDQSETSDKPKVQTMCRNFARGTCKKGAACIFAHELILSQLPGLYTFCRNFQNSACSYPKCKFVHATVFEKECFFRTGYLPPHTLAHLKEETVLQPPPPPPQPEETPAAVHPVYTNAPPPPTIPCIAPVTVPFTAVEPVLERNDPNLFRVTQAQTTSPKREWNEIDEVSSSPRDFISSEPLAKKCKNCDNNEFREQFIKTKVEKMEQSNREIIQKVSILNKKKSRLASVIGAVFKQSKSLNGTKVLNIASDKEKTLLTNNSFSTFLAKMLLNSESVAPPDAS